MSEAAYRELCRECFESLDRVDPAFDPAIDGAFELFRETCLEVTRDALREVLNSEPSERAQKGTERVRAARERESVVWLRAARILRAWFARTSS